MFMDESPDGRVNLSPSLFSTPSIESQDKKYFVASAFHRIAGLSVMIPSTTTALILAELFDPSEWVKSYRVSVSIMIAGSDEVIPPALSRNQHEDYTGPKRLEVVEGARHNDVVEQLPEWWRNVFAFWMEHSTTSRRK